MHLLQAVGTVTSLWRQAERVPPGHRGSAHRLIGRSQRPLQSTGPEADAPGSFPKGDTLCEDTHRAHLLVPGQGSRADSPSGADALISVPGAPILPTDPGTPSLAAGQPQVLPLPRDDTLLATQV